MIKYLLECIARFFSKKQSIPVRPAYTELFKGLIFDLKNHYGYYDKYDLAQSESAEKYLNGYCSIYTDLHNINFMDYLVGNRIVRQIGIEVKIFELLDLPEFYKYLADRKARHAAYLTGDSGNWIAPIGTGVRIPALDIRYDYYDADGDPYRAGQLRAIQDWYLELHPEEEAKYESSEATVNFGPFESNKLVIKDD